MRLLLIFLLISKIAFGYELGKRFNVLVGTDVFQAQYKTQRYEFNDYSILCDPTKNISRLALGLSYRILQDYPLYIGLRTNRIINAPTQTTARDTVLNKNADVYQKLISDSFILSTAVHKKILPFLVVTNARAKTLFVYSSGRNFQNDITTILYGGGASYLITPKNLISLTYFLGNDDFNIKRAIGVSYSYII